MSAGRPVPQPWLAAVAALVAVVVGFAAWRAVLGWSLLGWDSYPMIHAGRIQDAAGFFGTFTEELMDGRYPLGHFWRPVVHFAFALDHALFGLDPFGYHLSDLVVLLASAALVALLAERWSGAAGWPLGGLAAGLVFALHPLHFEVLPVAPRRADGLAVLFTLLALHAVLGSLRSEARGKRLAWAIAAGVACALALASKETGAIATAAVALLALLAPLEGPGAGEGRLARTLRVAGPALVLAGATFGLRTIALGGLGGGQESSLTGGLAHAPANAAVYARALVFPPSLARLDPGDPLPAQLALAAALALAILYVARGGARVRATALLLAGWALALVPLTGMSGLAQGWYAFPYLPVFALGAGLAASAAAEAARSRRLALALTSGLAAAALVAVAVGGSPFFEDASDFEHASRLEREFLAKFEERLAGAAPGRALTVSDCPTVIQRVTHAATGQQAYFTGPDQALDTEGQGLEPGRLIYVLASYSLEAFADLALGDGRARVSMPGLPPSSRASGPDVIDVTVLPPPLGFTPADG